MVDARNWCVTWENAVLGARMACIYASRRRGGSSGGSSVAGGGGDLVEVSGFVEVEGLQDRGLARNAVPSARAVDQSQAALACADLDTGGEISDPDVAMRHTLVCLAQRWIAMHEELKFHTAHLKNFTLAAAPEMLERFGVGFDSAAEMLITAGDNTDRIH